MPDPCISQMEFQCNLKLIGFIVRQMCLSLNSSFSSWPNLFLPQAFSAKWAKNGWCQQTFQTPLLHITISWMLSCKLVTVQCVLLSPHTLTITSTLQGLNSHSPPDSDSFLSIEAAHHRFISGFFQLLFQQLMQTLSSIYRKCSSKYRDPETLGKIKKNAVIPNSNKKIPRHRWC